MKEEVKAKKVAKPVLANQLTSTRPPPPEVAVTTAPAVMPAATLSLALRFLRKKDGSTMLQEGVNDVWTDVPMVVEK